MTGWLRELRLMPVVLIAIGCLFALKTLGLIFDGGYTLGQRLGSTDTLVVTRVPMTQTPMLRSPSTPLEMASNQPQPAKKSWMQDMFNYPGGGDITGSITTTKAAEKEAAEKAEASQQKPQAAEPSAAELKAAAGKSVPLDPQQQRSASAAERALLERLQERRQELDARARELDLRETLLKAAEKKLDGPPGATPKADGSPGAAAPAGRKDDSESARFKSLVTMYETMKPKEAAKIFDRLEIRVLIEVASQIKPQQMAAILAQMSPETAERLTVELASRASGERSSNPSNLPKIEGRPNGG
jgi:flagellar motility protein MotE (MotC chaperone)